MRNAECRMRKRARLASSDVTLCPAHKGDAEVNDGVGRGLESGDQAKPRSGAGTHDEVPEMDVFLLSGDRPTGGHVAI